MSAGSGVDGMMGTMMQPGALSTVMMTNNTDLQQQMLHMQQLQRLQLQQLQQQQQHSGHVLYDSLSPAQQAHLQMMQQQQQYGMACIPQQMMPVQVRPGAGMVIIQDCFDMCVFICSHGNRYRRASA
jgi:hypothetical protein